MCDSDQECVGTPTGGAPVVCSPAAAAAKSHARTSPKRSTADDASCFRTPRAKRSRRSPSPTRFPVQPVLDESHQMFWWWTFVLNGPLGVLLRSIGHMGRAWRVFSACTGRFSEAWSYEVCGIPIAKGSVDCCDNELRSYRFCINNHRGLLRHFYESMLEMEADHGGACHIHPGQCCCPADDEVDFAVISFPCQPWSSLANRKDRPPPDNHKSFAAVFGAEGSATSLVRKRHPHCALFENVDGFKTTKDSDGLTGLQKLVRVMMAIVVGGQHFYTGWACCRVCTDHWGAPGRSRCLEFRTVVTAPVFEPETKNEFIDS